MLSARYMRSSIRGSESYLASRVPALNKWVCLKMRAYRRQHGKELLIYSDSFAYSAEQQVTQTKLNKWKHISVPTTIAEPFAQGPRFESSPLRAKSLTGELLQLQGARH